MKIYEELGVQIPQIYLPKENIDLTKWAVIACDQFTSEAEYWREVKTLIGDSPSTLNLILPEVFLDNSDTDEKIKNIQTAMKQYVKNDMFQVHEGLIYVERTVNGKARKGIMLCLDLEQYDFKGNAELIHPTEGTVIDRLPARIKVREDAILELPHILVLIDDPNHIVIEPVHAEKSNLKKLYDFELMLESGHLSGYAIPSGLEKQIIDGLGKLANREGYLKKYSLEQDTSPIVFAMGDGNHSMAAAKEYWESIKPEAGMNHPARYALVEVVNVHDEGLEFEPIHRVLFNLKKDPLIELKNFFGDNLIQTEAVSFEELAQRVDFADGGKQVIGLVVAGKKLVVDITNPSSNLAVGTIQTFLDKFLDNGGAEKIDYIHGDEVLNKFASQDGNAGFYLPGMRKADLFKTVIVDGELPRKAFSMGHAREKRFYMEARRIA